ncbi:MAG: hypothetical protein HYV27_23435 [Candidatus Hydrogenedentes bacterium]|nr:hypothetical protein [Candidatus Hydrogenedentota bacterium]
MLRTIAAAGILVLILALLPFSAVAAEPAANVSAEDYPAAPLLPDPFLKADGSRVATVEEWRTQREALKKLILDLQYGPLLPDIQDFEIVVDTELWEDPPSRVDHLQVTAKYDPSLKLEAVLYRPRDLDAGPYPLILAVEPLTGNNARPIVELAIRRGYAIAGYQRHDLAPDEAGSAKGIYAAHPDYEGGALAVWAWGALQLRGLLASNKGIDSARVAITGHSRAGKVALLAGALDEGFTLVCPNGSGAGGAGCYRFSGAMAESLEAITQPERFGYWFHPNLRVFAGKEAHLPFDQHFLKALVAPRLLLSTEALGDLWANPRGAQTTHMAAREVYRFLGAEDRIGIHFREGQHDQTLEDWEALIDFADLHWRSKPTGRNFNTLPFKEETPRYDWHAPAAGR